MSRTKANTTPAKSTLQFIFTKKKGLKFPRRRNFFVGVINNLHKAPNIIFINALENSHVETENTHVLKRHSVLRKCDHA